MHEISAYYAKYENVIKEEAENAGERNIYGLEYRLRYTFNNFIKNAPNISGYFNFTYSDVTSSIHYNHELNKWEDGDTDLGDIAPIKFNIGFNLPFSKNINLFLRGNYIGSRKVYTRNPLRKKDYKIDSYFLVNSNLNIRLNPFNFSFKILNLFDKEYFHPGIQSANAGDDFTNRSKGFYNSLLPQEGRSFWFNIGIKM